MGKKSAVILIGSPGSGKSHLGQLMKERLSFYNLDTGELIKRMIFDKGKINNKIIQRQKKLYLSGKLANKTWVTSLLVKEIDKISKLDKNVVFSGSPRTLKEAKAITPLLLKNYGKNNVFIFLLKIDRSVAIKRLLKRRICSKCGKPFLPGEIINYCFLCGGKVIFKYLDNSQIIKIRFKEFNESTKLVIDYFEKLGLVQEIDAKLPPEKIFRNIALRIKKSF